jgi:hypothetical protein
MPRLATMPAMAGYVAMARVEVGRVRALPETASGRPERPGEPAPAGLAADATAWLEPDDAITLGERWERLRDQLAMLSFYLTDPDSWR